jgi:hypothetical protein
VQIIFLPILSLTGFGGSSLPDLYDIRMISFPYHPKQIVIYCGENDLAVRYGYSSTGV